jgi:hypothetical protein
MGGKMRNFFITLIMLLAATLFIPSTSFSLEISKNDINNLFNTEQYDRLEKIASELLKNKEKYPNGTWKLTMFYFYIYDFDKVNKSNFQHVVDRIKKWQLAYPDSPFPQIMLSKIYKQYARFFRGEGWAKDVKEEAWKPYYENMKIAYQYLDNPIAQKDPHSYSERINILKSAGGRNAKENGYAVLTEGIAKEPDFHPTYYAMALLLMPRWHGEQGEIKNFLEKYSASRGGVEGKLMYANALAYMSIYFSADRYPEVFNIKWSDLKKTLSELRSEWPNKVHAANLTLYFAALNKDTETVAQMKRILNKNKAFGLNNLRDWDLLSRIPYD